MLVGLRPAGTAGSRLFIIGVAGVLRYCWDGPPDHAETSLGLSEAVGDENDETEIRGNDIGGQDDGDEDRDEYDDHDQEDEDFNDDYKHENDVDLGETTGSLLPVGVLPLSDDIQGNDVELMCPGKQRVDIFQYYALSFA